VVYQKVDHVSPLPKQDTTLGISTTLETNSILVNKKKEIHNSHVDKTAADVKFKFNIIITNKNKIAIAPI
jgi:hypothetical protein